MSEPTLNPSTTQMLVATAGVTGDRLFAAMARTLAEHFGARWALVGELVAPDRVRTLAAIENGAALDNFEYPLEGSPCQQVLMDAACVYPTDVAHRFPDDHLLQQMGVESYFGIAVRDSQREPIGILVAMHDQPKFENEKVPRALELFAMRIGAEIERQRLERELAQHHKLESLGALAGGIAHDFNNLLVGILGNIDHARQTLDDDEVDARTALDDAASASRAAAALTQQLLAYAGRQPRTPQPIAIGELVTETTRLFDSVLPAGATRRFEIAPDLPPVFGDTNQLRQIVMNLMTNAAEALQDRPGTVTIRLAPASHNAVERCSHTFRSDGFDKTRDHVCLEVRDDGVGMTAEQLTRVFDPFWSSKGERRGLGMSTVLGALRSHRGAICIHSRRGAGTTVQVLLPTATSTLPAEPSAPTEERQPQAAPPAVRLLIVDDNDIVRATLGRALRRLGAEVLEADGGEAALALFESSEAPIDGAIVDRMMPGMSGNELIARLRALDAEVPLILTTGLHDDAGSVDPNVQATLSKPWNLDDLRELLQRHITRR